MSTNDESEWKGTRFGREESTGVVMGLGWEQVSFIAAGVGVLMLGVVTIGSVPVKIIFGLLVLVVTAGIGIPRIAGKSLLEWMMKFFKNKGREKTGQNEYVPPIDGADATWNGAGELELVNPAEVDYVTVGAASRSAEPKRDKKGRIIPPKGLRMNLPGEFNELQMFQAPGGAAFVYDPVRKEGTIVAQIVTERALNLESDDHLEDRLRAWADMQSTICRIPGVARVQCSDQTTMIAGTEVYSWYAQKGSEATWVTDPVTGEAVQQSGSHIDPWLAQSFEDLMNQADGQAVHEEWIAIVLSKNVLYKQIQAHGGRLRGFMDVAVSVMGTIEGALPGTGANVKRWHTPRSLAALCRGAQDPASSTEISTRMGEREGVHPGAAGPMRASWEWDRYLSDGAFHRTFKISEWPQSQASLGFLDKFVFAGDFRHTVSLYLKPRDTGKAMKDVAGRKSTWQTNENIRVKMARPSSMRHDRQYEDVIREESELVSGHAALKLVCLITVSAFTPEELEAYSADVKTRAAEAGCEVRPLYSDQEAAFVASAMPLGRLAL